MPLPRIVCAETGPRDGLNRKYGRSDPFRNRGKGAGNDNIPYGMTLTLLSLFLISCDRNDGTVRPYIVAPGPVGITDINPSSGPTAGGTIVTIAGSGFISGAGVDFGGTPSPIVTFASSTALTAVTPAGSAGPTDVRVNNPDGGFAIVVGGFTFVPPPTVTSITPGLGPEPGGTSVAVSGTGFWGTPLVSFGAGTATSVSVTSPTSLTCVSPPGAGTVSVTVANQDAQSGTLTSAFPYTPPPVVASVSPASGPTSGGTTVTVTGSSFQSGAAVTFGGTSATNGPLHRY